MKRYGAKAARIGPVLLCSAAILLTTLLLSMIDRFVPTEHLMLRVSIALVAVRADR
jgi:hypothetical protein